jgi:tetratricopeptide (TPR) repeat protein
MRRISEIILIASLSLPLCAVQAQTSARDSTVKSIEAAQSTLAAAPDSEGARLSLAELYLKAGRNGDAVATLKDYADAHSQSVKALRLLALAYVRKEDYPNAKDAADQALRMSPNDAPNIEVLAMAHAGMQDTDMAERLFLQALKLDLNSVEANYQLGLLYVRDHKSIPDAIRFLEKARTAQPNLTGIDLALGSAYLESGDLRQAVSFLQSAAKADTGAAEAYYLLASAWVRLNQPDKAEAALGAFNTAKKAAAGQRAREMQAQADYQQGVNLLSNSDNLDAACSALAKAAAALPDFDPAYYRMAQVKYLQGDLGGALTSIRHALSLNPLEPEYYFVLARCLEDNDRTAALQAIESAARLKPGVADFEELLQSLRRTEPTERAPSR